MGVEEYLPKRPARTSLARRGNHFLQIFWYLVQEVIAPVEPQLGKADRELPDMPHGHGENLRGLCKELFDASEKRFATIQGKAQQMFGFLSFAAPMAIGLVTFLWNSTSSPAGIWVLLILLGLVVSLLALTLLAILRCLWVTSLATPFLEAAYDTHQHQYRDHSAEQEAVVFLECALINQVRNDQLTDFVRAGQSFFGLAVALLILCAPLVMLSHRPPSVTTPVKVEVTFPADTRSELSRAMVFTRLR